MKFVPKKLTRTIGKQILKTKKNSPHIFFALGLAGVGAGTVMACRATLKVQPILDQHKYDLDTVRAMKNDPARTDSDYAEKGYPRDLGYVYGKTGVALVKLYGPSLAISLAGVAALSGSHVQLTRRNAGLTATLAAVSKAYDDYRQRMIEELGVEKELDIYRDITEVDATDESGKKVKTKLANPTRYSPYARIFDESSTAFEKHPAINKAFLTNQQGYWNDVLRTRGHVFLNEVYQSLGFDHSQAGAIVGWLFEDRGEGDGYIDFGIFEPDTGAFVNGYEPRIILDFNVDGIIFKDLPDE